jgi:hypothetical protein
VSNPAKLYFRAWHKPEAVFKLLDWRPPNRGQEYAKLVEACRQPEASSQLSHQDEINERQERKSQNPEASTNGEFASKHRMELAEEALALFYEAREIIGFARSPAYYASESAARKPALNETPDQKRIRDDAFVTLERLNRHGETFKRIHALRFRFRAQFGVGAVAPFEDFSAFC